MANGDKKKKSKARVAGHILSRTIFPWHAMRQTWRLAKKEGSRTKDNLAVLKELSTEARQTIATSKQPNDVPRNDSFDEAMRNRSKNALPLEELYKYFLRKKRVVLAVAAFFALSGLYGLVSGIWNGHPRGIVLSVITLVASQPLFFLIALEAQLRLWQLRTQRLSKEEQGGLQDFRREVHGWWWMTLDPEFKRTAQKRL